MRNSHLSWEELQKMLTGLCFTGSTMRPEEVLRQLENTKWHIIQLVMERFRETGSIVPQELSKSHPDVYRVIDSILQREEIALSE